MRDADLDRLLRAAAKVTDEGPTEPPFGFDTRVIALAGQNGNDTGLMLRQLVRRAALVAAAVIVLATAGAYLQFERTDDSEPFTNEFAMADSAIQDEVGQ